LPLIQRHCFSLIIFSLIRRLRRYYAIAAAEIRFSPFCHAMPIRRQLTLAEACFDAFYARRFSLFDVFHAEPLSSMADIFDAVIITFR
jgi:hypothetical protein